MLSSKGKTRNQAKSFGKNAYKREKNSFGILYIMRPPCECVERKVEENKVRVCCSAKKILVCQGSRRRKLVGDLMFSTGYIFRERGVEARLLTSGAKNLTRNRRRRLLSTDPRREGRTFLSAVFPPLPPFLGLPQFPGMLSCTQSSIIPRHAKAEDGKNIRPAATAAACSRHK